MSTIVKNIHIFKDGAWHPIKKVFKDSFWRTMKGIFYGGVWYEIGASCVVMPDGCAIATNEHPRWDEDATYYGTNNFGIDLTSGYYRASNGAFYGPVGSYGGYWTSTEVDTTDAHSRNFHSYDNNFWGSATNKTSGYYIRGVKYYGGTASNGTILSNEYTDGDGNTYDAVVIGKRIWTVKSLYTTKYQNGDSIPNITNSATWGGLTTGAYCWFNNDYTTYGQYYGALYNWYAVDNGLISGDGWSVPTVLDWTYLYDYLLDTNWCNGVVITEDNVAQYLKSCRQVNHPLG